MDDTYGATHYSVMKDGVTPQMFYKQISYLINDGTTHTSWHYLTFADLWHGSMAKEDFFKTLKPIGEFNV